IHINSREVELISSESECLKAQTKKTLNIKSLLASYPRTGSCSYKTAIPLDISAKDDEFDTLQSYPNTIKAQYSLLFYFHSSAISAEFLTFKKPEIIHSDGIYCQSSFDHLQNYYVVSCQPESVESRT
ncbi:hypothetical protein, partial [Sinorhizobium meliloti]|uniref:hypothetical protein n=1 Tax=Rhizobium meliloti TaxID=382 RepID=UPI001AEF892B